jgi:hypothetical protein
MTANKNLRNLMAKADKEETKVTLSDVLGTGVKIIQPLAPTVGDTEAFCVQINEVKPLENGLEFIVTPTNETRQYYIRLLINNKPEMFIANLTPLCGQIGIDVLTVENLKSKVGQEIYVLAIRNNAYINYSFNLNRIAAFCE